MNTVTYGRISSYMGNPDIQLKDDPEAYMDTCSGTIPFKEREMGGLVYNLAKQGKVDEIRVSRLDRLGRDTIDILTTLKELTKMKVNVYSKQEGINTMVNGKVNETAKLIINVMATLAEWERDRIAERISEGVKRAAKEGAYKNNGKQRYIAPEVFLARKTSQKALGYLSAKEPISMRDIASKCKISLGQVQKVKRLAIVQGLL